MNIKETIEEVIKKRETLIFELPSNEYKFSFTINEILEEIKYQKNEFEEKNNFEPKYISIKDDLNNFLFGKLIDDVINIEKYENYNPKTIFGMKIISRF